MEFYKEESNEIVGYDDIYYYIYQKNKLEIIGKYSEKFKAKIKIKIIYQKNNYLEKNVLNFI